MIVLLRKNQLTDASCEAIMLFCNMVLCLTDEAFRFPRSATTFEGWCNSMRFFSASIKEYASCITCHAIHPYDTEDEKKQVQQQRYCLDSGIFSKPSICEEELIAPNQYGTIAPDRSFFNNSLIDTFRSFFLRYEFVESINEWKQRQTLPETLSDIYDGLVWKNFKLRETDDKPFVLQSDYNLMLTLNCDRFQAYKDGYSVGAIYLTMQNLPREVRNLRSNSILVCLINGPKEPKTYEMN
ncbi:hypothetical protein A0J61_11408, partial [Choanephora cucurbitarum]